VGSNPTGVFFIKTLEAQTVNRGLAADQTNEKSEELHDRCSIATYYNNESLTT